jgi:hypothetical protein
MWDADSPSPDFSERLPRVKSAVLTVRRSLPVYPEKQTFSEDGRHFAFVHERSRAFLSGFTELGGGPRGVWDGSSA